MTYRDDRDADRARIEALETELATAQKKVEELEGRSQNALVLASGNSLALAGEKRPASTRWLGAPLELEMQKTFDGVFPGDRFEDLVVLIRSVTRDVGRSEILKSSLVWQATAGVRSPGAALSVTVTVKDGRTTLAVDDRLGALAGAIFGGVGGGVGGGALAAPVLASIAVPLLTPVFVLGWLGGVWAGTRAIFKRAAKSRARGVQRVFDALAGEIAKTIASSSGP